MPHWRKMTWALVVWLIPGAVAGAYLYVVPKCYGLTGDALLSCQVGLTLMGVCLSAWFMGLLSLGAIWLSTRGSTAPAGSVCGRCGKPLSPYWRDRCYRCKATYAEFPPQPTSDR